MAEERPFQELNTTELEDKKNLQGLRDTDNAEQAIWQYDINALSSSLSEKFIRYWENGNKRWEWEYKDGKRADGLSYGYWPDGTLKQEMTWKDNKSVGRITLYHDTGHKEREYTQVDREDVGLPGTGIVPHGKHTSWFHDGGLDSEGYMNNGSKNGEWIYYWGPNHFHPTGSIQKIQTWDNDKLINEEIK